MPEDLKDSGRPAGPQGSSAALAFAALGVVFGDIGTSPLYALQTVLTVTGKHPAREATLGTLSLIFWTLIIVTSLKYVTLAMRIDNDGEGGILALMSLLGVKGFGAGDAQENPAENEKTLNAARQQIAEPIAGIDREQD